MFAPTVLLCFLLALLSGRLQQKLRQGTVHRPHLIFVAPVLLTTLFCATASYYGMLSWRLAILAGLYTLIPTACIYIAKCSLFDLAVILMLWLPLELSVGAGLVQPWARGVLHATAYGVAVTLGVFLFLIARAWDGMKYSLPVDYRRDFKNVALGYASAVVLLIPLGLWIGFLNRPHLPRMSISNGVARVFFSFFGTAFPEEILFRGLIQNWFVQRLPQVWLGVAIGAVIFGAAHLNNAPGPIPNWRYMAEATVAGMIFGTVFLRSTSIFASVAVHTAVNMTKHLFF